MENKKQVVGTTDNSSVPVVAPSSANKQQQPSTASASTAPTAVPANQSSYGDDDADYNVRRVRNRRRHYGRWYNQRRRRNWINYNYNYYFDDGWNEYECQRFSVVRGFIMYLFLFKNSFIFLLFFYV